MAVLGKFLDNLILVIHINFSHMKFLFKMQIKIKTVGGRKGGDDREVFFNLLLYHLKQEVVTPVTLQTMTKLPENLVQRQAQVPPPAL